MGQQVCKPHPITNDDPLGLNFGVDQSEPDVDYTEPIVCSNRQVQKILDNYATNLRQNRKMYKDPNMSTQAITLKPLRSKEKDSKTKCTYERPYKFLTNCSRTVPYKLIDSRDSHASSIQVKDQIMQYFGVFLCFLANKPTQIAKIISTQENLYGVHAIEAYRNGRPISFIIDDYVLCKVPTNSQTSLQPMFTQPQKGIYMWPCILEKAWFKIRGNFLQRKVEENTPEEVFETFLPLPIQKIQLRDGFKFTSIDSLSQHFNGFEGGVSPKDKGFILRSKKNPEHDIGLSGGRCYYLLDTFIFEQKRMFYLRNPCGNMPFRGTHDSLSSKLEEVLLSQRKHMQKWIGNFIIDEEEFLEQIAQILIVHYIPGNKITSYCFQCESEQQFFLGFDLKDKGSFNLSIVQSSQGLIPKSKNIFYPFIYHVVRLSDNKLIGGYDNKQGCFGVKNTYILDNFNEIAVPGKYLIRLKKKYQQINNMQLFLVGLCTQEIKFQIINHQEMYEKWKDFFKVQGARKLLSEEANKIVKNQDIGHVVCWLGDIVYVYVENKSKNKEISIQVNFPQLMNLHCTSHPEIRRSEQWHSYKFTDRFLIVFEKISLTAETHIRQYHIEAY